MKRTVFTAIIVLIVLITLSSCGKQEPTVEVISQKAVCSPGRAVQLDFVESMASELPMDVDAGVVITSVTTPEEGVVRAVLSMPSQAYAIVEFGISTESDKEELAEAYLTGLRETGADILYKKVGLTTHYVVFKDNSGTGELTITAKL